MTAGDAGIERLAQLAGIEPSYRDYFGRETFIPESTKRALLQALGLHIASARDVADAVRTFEERTWLRALEPVTVSVHGAPLRIAVTVAAADAGISREWRVVEERGATHRGALRLDDFAVVATSEVAGTVRERRFVDVPVALPLGYHTLTLDGCGETTVVTAPSRCYLPSAIDRGAKVWGLAVQLYSLRSARNWGIGDFGDLRTLAALATRVGAGAVGLNPLHELDPANPAAASPYSPFSRRHLSSAYLDVEAIDDFAECSAAQALVRDPTFQRRLVELRSAPLVDYAAVATCKRPVAELLYESFRARHQDAGTARGKAFADFRASGGRALQRLAIFQALREHFALERPHEYGWRGWPDPFRDPASASVADFANEHAARVDYFAYLQWNADMQLAAAAGACAGMTVGLYRDLAVGAEPNGAEAWGEPGVLVDGVAVGAPADDLNAYGQNWGLAPLSPVALFERAYRPFAELMRANMRHAGAVRIDHAMSLQRLFWIPAGRPATEGAYVRYPLADLLAIVALESVRSRCLVVGEDLGTVPEGFRERLAWSRILSYRLLYFSREADGTFTAPEDFPPLSLVSPGTHDLPSLPGYWLERDLALRAQLGLLPAGVSLADATAERARERDALLDALFADGDLDDTSVARLRSAGSSAVRADVRTVVDASYRYLARSRARLLMASLEDVLGTVEQINVPGTTGEHPNWRRKASATLEDLATDERFASFAGALHDVRALPAPPTVPASTYRLQFHGGFGFRDAERILPYLQDLGISHVYASPFLAARGGSTHGYDIIDHAAFNEEVGTRAEFERLIADLHRRGMGLLLDFVPNHMGVGVQNAWWQDVLEWGQFSPYAPYFDIDWHPARHELQGKVLLPFLGAPYGETLERGELTLSFDAAAGTFSLTYFDQRFPLAVKTYADVLATARECAAESGADAKVRSALDAVLAVFQRRWRARSAADRRRLRDDADAAKDTLARAVRDPALTYAVDSAVRRLNGTHGRPATFEALHRLIAQQYYRPAFWRVAFDEINYRRFFDINDLAGLRVEYAECFAFVHQFVFRLIEDGFVQGLRLDHVDGLFDPKAYTTLLRSRALAMDHPLYLVVEKILARHETLREDWLVSGSTGYEFANLVNGLFIDARAEARFELMYRAFTSESTPFEDILLECKRLTMDVNLASELEVLTTELDRIARSDLRSSDLTRTILRNALEDVIAAFPVYRTYVDGEGASAEDRRYIEWAIAQARKRSSTLEPRVFDLIGSMLSTDAARKSGARYRPRDVVHFAMKFQQYTAPVMAKSLEDTAFYRYPRLLSLNEVGGDPRRFGSPPAAFHRAMRERGQKTPHALSTTSTHDTKRGEDARLRIDALTELPSLARTTLVRLERINRRHKRDVDGTSAPDRVDEWLMYQTLIGSWPLDALDEDASGAPAPGTYAARIESYMRKAQREAKRHTSWANPNAAYEEATAAFVRAVLAEGRESPFWTEFRRLAEPASRIAMVHGLAQSVLKLTAPGVPDIYQGAELWDLSLVDPDNRRPVDWEVRERLAAVIAAEESDGAALASRLLATWRDGAVKLFVTRTILRLRQARREMFLTDDYTPLETAGRWADRLIAFARRGVVVAVPRLIGELTAQGRHLPLADRWDDTVIAPRRVRIPRTYRNAFTAERLTIRPGEPFRAAEVFSQFPVAVLVPEDE